MTDVSATSQTDLNVHSQDQKGVTTEENKDEEHKVLAFKPRVFSGGTDGSNWLLEIPNGSVFLARPTDANEYKGFLLMIYQKKRRIGDSRAVEIAAINEPRVFVDSDRFSKMMTFVAGYEDEQDADL
jgi:hypothetical protein